MTTLAFPQAKLRAKCLPADVLFISEQSLWPLDQGYRVHGFNMARAMSDAGVSVGISSMAPLPEDAPQNMRELHRPWPRATDEDIDTFVSGWRGIGMPLRRKIASHQGLDLLRMAGVVRLVKKTQPKVVIALGQHGPILLKGLANHGFCKRIWYAADEPANFQLSCLRRLDPNRGVIGHATHHLKHAALYTAIEYLFSRGLDGAIGVSPRDTWLLRNFAGIKQAVTIRNGVDLDYFAPAPLHMADLETAKNVVFWGRMDFEPNVDAVCWFTENIWPSLRYAYRNATFDIVGKNPSARVVALGDIEGVNVVGPVADIREQAHIASAVVLPMRCGCGIKNKLLEAAAMALPIVASPKAIAGLDFGDPMRHRPPIAVAHTPDEWVQHIRRIWSDPTDARALREGARNWVLRRHTWSRAAEHLMAFCSELGVRIEVDPSKHREREETNARMAA